MQLNCKNALFFLIINMSISCANAADITMIKYGYGLIYWEKKAYTADPMVYPLQESYAYKNIIEWKPSATTADLRPQYEINEAESNQIKKERAIDFSLKVWKKIIM